MEYFREDGDCPEEWLNISMIQISDRDFYSGVTQFWQTFKGAE
jgi:hypothetical protein